MERTIISRASFSSSLAGAALLAAALAAPAGAAVLSDAGLSLGSSVVYSNNQVTFPNNPWFIAGQANPAWESCGAAGWTEMPFNTVSAGNAGGWFSAGTGRFTAPVSGLYLFAATQYIYASGTSMPYIHFDVAVNGSIGGGGRVGPSHQITGTSAGEGSYGVSTRAVRLLYLTAGQYASVYNYCSAAAVYRYGDHSYFSGVLLQ
jgi:hypothetical protein